ncbi:unnamed protein product [Linum trigynum]|uniref:AAA+ ATPase domain-containing protein n=1 Tax=Linum trigynum TaxID=586398 RepID=A0AAV2GM34_9ROSI
MTKAVARSSSRRILKDANGNISDHLRNHIHLTNCIHLKNHMHKQSPVLNDRALMRDLISLQRSRSLRDPSASPPSSWKSPSVVDLLPKKGDHDEEDNSLHIQEGRRSSVGRRESSSRRLSGGSPQVSIHQPSKVVPVSDRSSKSGMKEGSGRVRREESSTRKSSSRTDGVNGLSFRDTVSGNSRSRDWESRQQKSKHSEDDEHIKSLSQQLKQVAAMDSDVAASSSNIHRNGRLGGVNRVKRRKFRGARGRRSRGAPSRDIGGGHHQKEMSAAASNSLLAQEREVEEYGDQNVTHVPRNGCGIPWNWSRIHDRGKTFLDRAGKSLACGQSESRLRRGSHKRDMGDMPMASDQSSSAASRSGSEALPLLDQPSAGSSDNNARWTHDYSGELGLYADNLLRNDLDSDLASEARSGDRQGNHQGQNHNRRHQNLTQKYMPRSFRDLVGQNLVSQALANAVVKRKVGLLYVFYGPHGTGKTSCARIFARALNCRSMEQSKPCGYCNSCSAHDMGKNKNIREVGPNFDFERFMDLLDNMIVSQLPSHYRVFIFDDCDTLSPECWSAISKVVDRAPRRVVIILVSSSLDVLPHIIISRCQKFFFPKLKDADIIYTLQWIASREDIDIDKDALKLIASRSDGSLRDAEMTLEQLSLLGQKVSVPLIQELVGLISDEKLVDLLDLALSADTVNTVKNLRVIMETGVEPLALMSQLATVITDILAGTYDFTRERHRRKFFKRQPMSKEEMEKLRQALKTLSEAEKQLRMSNDKLTWLTAALLQLAPDQQYLLPSSEPSLNHSPLPGRRDTTTRTVVEQYTEMAPHSERSLPSHPNRLEKELPARTSIDQHGNRLKNGANMEMRRQIPGKIHMGYEEIWIEVLENIQMKGLRDFLYQEGTLISVTFGPAPTVQLVFSSQLTKSKAEKFSTHILHAFESVLGSPVTIEIRTEPCKSSRPHTQLVLPSTKKGSSTSHVVARDDRRTASRAEEQYDNAGRDDEIVEEQLSPKHADLQQHKPAVPRRVGELSHSRSLVRGKVSLAHVIQQRVEGCNQPNTWSRRTAVSIAEKLEQENLRLEPRSRSSMLCWKATRVTRRKLSRLKVGGRRPQSLLNLISCGKYLSSKPRSPT